MAGKFPPKYMGGVFSGQAVGGIFASATNVLVIALGADPVYAAFSCFVIAVVFLASALFFFIYVTKSEFFQYFLNENTSTPIEKPDEAGPGGDESSAKFIQDKAEVDIKVSATKKSVKMIV